MFLKNIDWEEDSGGCWNCTSHKIDAHGYPKTLKHRKSIGVYRHVYEECFGEVPTGLVVRHKCDNKKCINPEHLEIGTPKQNTHDRLRNNTFGNRLKKEDVREIRNMKDCLVPYGKTLNQSILARKFGVSRSAICQILKGNTWGAYVS